MSEDAGHPPEQRPVLLGMEWFSERPGGLNRYFADLVTALHGLGVPLRAVVLGPAPQAPQEVRAVSRSDHGMLRRLLAVARQALAGEVDVLDVHFALYGLIPVLLRPRTPVVVHFHGPWAREHLVEGDRSPLRFRLRRAVERTVYRRAEAVVTLSEAFADIVRHDYGLHPARVRVLRPGVDLDRFRPRDRATARRELGLPSDAFIAVTTRRLAARMGLDVLLRAWVDQPPHALLVVAGTGPEEEHLRRLAAELGVDERVRFVGRVEDGALPLHYAAADVSVVPSVALEGFGLVVLESLACGTPVIASDTGGMAEVLRHLDRSPLVPPRDVAALSAALTRARTVPDRLPTRDDCRAFAERFTWDRVARATMDLYEEVSGGGRRPTRVVFYDHHAEPSGGELAMVRLIRAMGERVDPYVLLGADGPLVGLLRDDGVPVEVLPVGPVGRRRRHERGSWWHAGTGAAAATTRLARRLRMLRPDVLHTNTTKAGVLGGLAGRLAGVPVVWHLRDRLSDDYLSPASAVGVRALARVLPHAVIANSRATKTSLGRTRRLVRVVPSAVASPEAPLVPGAGVLRVGMLGRIAPWKGQPVFLQAFAIAFPGGVERARIVGGAFFGDEPYLDEIRATARRLGIADRVDLVGHTDDPAGELADLDVLVHASVVPEPFGQVVVEGMAAGLAVVATDAGGPAEVVTDGVDGLLVPCGDADALADALRRLATDPDLRARLGESARRTARRFAPERVGPAVVDVYDEVLAGRRVAGG